MNKIKWWFWQLNSSEINLEVIFITEQTKSCMELKQGRIEFQRKDFWMVRLWETGNSQLRGEPTTAAFFQMLPPPLFDDARVNYKTITIQFSDWFLFTISTGSCRVTETYTLTFNCNILGNESVLCGQFLCLAQQTFTWRMGSSEMLRRVALVRADVSEELSASIISVTRIGELGTLAVTSNRRTHAACVTSQKTPFFIVTAVKTSNLT
jgi:hypothetical protein